MQIQVQEALDEVIASFLLAQRGNGSGIGRALEPYPVAGASLGQQGRQGPITVAILG